MTKSINKVLNSFSHFDVLYGHICPYDIFQTIFPKELYNLYHTVLYDYEIEFDGLMLEHEDCEDSHYSNNTEWEGCNCEEEAMWLFQNFCNFIKKVRKKHPDILTNFEIKEKQELADKWFGVISEN